MYLLMKTIMNMKLRVEMKLVNIPTIPGNDVEFDILNFTKHQSQVPMKMIYYTIDS